VTINSQRARGEERGIRFKERRARSGVQGAEIRGWGKGSGKQGPEA